MSFLYSKNLKQHNQDTGDKIKRCDDDYADTQFVYQLLLGKNHLIPVGMFDEVAELPLVVSFVKGFIPRVLHFYVP
jgi:hypothetical protein